LHRQNLIWFPSEATRGGTGRSPGISERYVADSTLARRRYYGAGGDYLDYFSLSDGMIGIDVGDLSGKGLPAAKYAALAVGTLRGIHKTGQHPTQVMALLNKRLPLRKIPSGYTAIQYVQLDPITAQSHLSSAGMPGPMLLRAGECRVLKVAGIPPGRFPEINYDHLTLQLEPRGFLTVLHGWFDRRAQYPTSRIRSRGAAASLRKPCRKIPAGIAGPHLLNHPEIYGRPPAV